MSDDNPLDPYDTPNTAPEPAAEPAPAPSPAARKFLACRWHKAADGTSPGYCTHRDVLSMAGATGFSADSWCTDCPHYKVKRVPRKSPFA